MVDATLANWMGGSSRNTKDSRNRGRDSKNLADKLNIIQNFSTTSVAPISSHSSTIFKADTGASKHFVRNQDQHILHNIETYKNSFVTLPNKDIIQSSKQGTLPLSTSSTANKALIFPNSTNSSLLSIGQLCDDDCIAIFNRHATHIYKNTKIILSGKRNNTDGLRNVTFQKKLQDPPHTTINTDSLQANTIIEKNFGLLSFPSPSGIGF